MAFTSRKGEVFVQAVLTAGGVAWCMRTAPPNAELALPRLHVKPVTDSAAVLASLKLEKSAFEGPDETGVEATLAGGARSPLRKKAVAEAAVKRFVEVMSKRGFPCAE